MGEMLSAMVLTGAADVIAAQGGNPTRVAQRAKVPLAALFDPGLAVLGYAVVDFFELAAEECRCRNFGLLMAESSSLAVVGPVWSLLSTAGTIVQMVDDLVSNFEIFSEAAIVGLEQTDDGVVMSFEARAGHCDSELQLVEYALAITCNELRRHCPPDWQPETVQFRHAAPGDMSAHRQIFGPNLMFEQDRNAIYLGAGTLRQERRPDRPETRMAAERSLRELGDRHCASIAARVEAIIRSPGNLATSVGQASALVGATPRSLQRRLAYEGTSLKAIKDTVRSDLALKYVLQSSLAFGDIAEMLGYSELSAFTRAFRRWHGVPAIRIRRSERQRNGRSEVPAGGRAVRSPT